MNNINYKTITRALILTITALHYLTTAAPRTPWYYTHLQKHNDDGIKYKKNCSLINFAQKIRQAGLLIYYRATHKKANFDIILTSLQEQLKEFETWILELEEEALIAIKEKYAISDEIWHKYLNDTKRIKDSNKQAMLQSHGTVIHDHNVPADILEMLITLLEQNNINPQSVNIIMDNAQQAVIAQTKMFVFIPIKNSNNDLVYNIEYIPARITIFPRANNGSLSEKMSYCAHEVQHLVSQHPITEVILIDYLKHYCGITVEEFKQSAEYKRFAQVHEAQAEILAAIVSPKIAHCMKSMRKRSYYPQHLYEEHFYDISTIDMLWNIHERLSGLMTT